MTTRVDFPDGKSQDDHRGSTSPNVGRGGAPTANLMVGGRGLGTRTLRLYLPLSLLLILMLFPFYWMLITSIKPNRELYNARIMPMIVYQPTLKHYVDLIFETNFLTWTYNTFLVAIVSTAVSLVLGTMTAYPLARMNFPGAAVVAIGVAATYLVPQPLLFIPMSDIINKLGLGNTLQAVMLTYPTLLIPFCAWLLMGYFKSVPRELEEAARIDGASRFQAMTRIVLAAVHARPPVRGDLRLHAGPERVPLRAHLPHHERRADGAGGRDHRADPRRRVLLGPAHGGGACSAPSRWP